MVQTDGRAGGRAYGHVITKFSRMGGLLYFRTHGAPIRELRCNQLSFFGEFKKFVPYCWRFTTQASRTFLAFVILLLEPLLSFVFFLIYFNYLVLVFYILQRETYCHHYFDILLSLFYLLKQVKQFLAPRSNKSEQHNFLKISLIIMHRSWEYREKVDDPKQNRHRSVF